MQITFIFIGTYRFLSVIRQTAVLIGEPKHGVWRIQDNGHVREWRRHGNIGLDQNVDPNSASLTPEQMNIIAENYASFIPEEGAGGYKAPENQFTDGYHDYLDLTIYHPKYGGKYDDHEPIDLAHFYCTMSQAGFPHELDVWRFAMGQPLVNKIGPLGKRAGENYQKMMLYLSICESQFACVKYCEPTTCNNCNRPFLLQKNQVWTSEKTISMCFP